MNSRLEFNERLFDLLSEMTMMGEHFLIDFVKRSDEEQKRLFQIGRDEDGNKVGDTVTDCDGVKKQSWHQYGRAVDIYFQDKGMIVPPIKGFSYWHRRWEELGGHPELLWDRGHFEG